MREYITKLEIYMLVVKQLWEKYYSSIESDAKLLIRNRIGSFIEMQSDVMSTEINQIINNLSQLDIAYIFFYNFDEFSSLVNLLYKKVPIKKYVQIRAKKISNIHIYETGKIDIANVINNIAEDIIEFNIIYAEKINSLTLDYKLKNSIKYLNGNLYKGIDKLINSKELSIDASSIITDIASNSINDIVEVMYDEYGKGQSKFFFAKFIYIANFITNRISLNNSFKQYEDISGSSSGVSLYCLSTEIPNIIKIINEKAYIDPDNIISKVYNDIFQAPSDAIIQVLEPNFSHDDVVKAYKYNYNITINNRRINIDCGFETIKTRFSNEKKIFAYKVFRQKMVFN